MKKALILLTYVFFALILLIPLGKVIVGAWDDGWSGFADSVSAPEALHALGISAIILLFVTVLNTVFGVLLAILLVRETRIAVWVKTLLNSMVDLPFAVSPVIAGLMLILLMGPHTLLGTFFDEIGVKMLFALPSMIIATLFVTFPLMVREVMPVLQEIGTAQEEAASTLGASSWRVFWSITWPSIRWGVLYGVVLTIARALGEFGAVLVVSGNIINQTQTATTLVYQQVEDFHYVAANALSLVLVSASVIVLLLLEWAKRRKEVFQDAN
ncbi:MAG: sulfate ABC transporter permease subunit [Tumebacillaceae bacterium]